MPHKDELDNSSAGMQSPEPITEGSLTPELISEHKDVSDAMSEESVCSKCGGSKTRKDKGLKPSKLTCKCKPKPDELQKEENTQLRDFPDVHSGTQSPEPITEGSLTPELISELRDVSDAMSEESICSKCGGSKTSRDRGLKARIPCRCRSKPDEIQKDEENIPLRDCAETDAAVQESAQIEETEVGEHSLAMSSEPSQAEDPSTKQPPAQGIIQQQEPTNGCVEEICDCIQDRMPECNWCRFVILMLFVLIIAIIIGVILGLSSLSGSNAGFTMIRRTNFTADEI